jgi:hypothetical protein
VRKRNPKRSGGGAATSYVNSFRSQATDPNAPEQTPEQQMMEDKFLTYDHTKPDENENRKKLIEERVWAQRMNKTTGEKQGLHPNAAYGSTRKAGGTYKASVLDYLNQKPATPLSAGDILKLEELARTARSGSGKDKGNDWRPPTGLMGNSPPDGNPMDAVQERDDYILQNGGVPPPSRPPPLISQYSNPHDFNNDNYQYQQQHQQRLNHNININNNNNTSTTTINSTTNNNNTTTNSQHHRHKSSQDYPSSDDSYRLASSPDNSEYPLMASAAALGVEYNLKQQASSLPSHPPPPQPHYYHTYPTSITSSASSQTLQDFSSKSMVTLNVSNNNNNNNNTRPPPTRLSSVPRIHHGNPLPPPTSVPPPIPSELPPLPALPKPFTRS